MNSIVSPDYKPTMKLVMNDLLIKNKERIENKKYWETPGVFIFPSIYVGYQSFKNRDYIISNIKNYNNMIPLSESIKV